MTFSRLTLFLALTALVMASVWADACTFDILLGKHSTVMTADKARACLTSVPFSAARREGLLKGLKDLVELYSFTDIATCTDCAQVDYQLGVDLHARLAKIEAATYANDYEMQQDLFDTFVALFDAHTMYVAPAGMRDMLFVRPFILGATDATGPRARIIASRELEFGGVSFSKVSTVAGVAQDPQPFVGKEIQFINGMPVLEYLEHLGKRSVGNYKDPAVRFNAILTGVTAISSTIPGGIPPALTETYNFTDGSSFTVDLLCFMSTVNFNSVESLAKLYDTAPSATARSPAAAFPSPLAMMPGDKVFIDPNRVLAGAFNESGETLEPASAAQIAQNNLERDRRAANPQPQSLGEQPLAPMSMMMPDPAAPLRASVRPLPRRSAFANGTYTKRGYVFDGAVSWGTFSLRGQPTVAVLRVGTFAAGPDFITFNKGVLGMARDVQEYSAANGIDTLVIDLAGNGGGYVFTSSALLQMLFKSYQTDPLTAYSQYDYRMGRTGSTNIRAINRRSAGDSVYGVPCENETFTAFVFEADGALRAIERGSGKSDYSGVWNFPADMTFSSSSIVGIDYTPTFFFAKTIAITDGTCGSACSQFLSKGIADNVLTAVSYGGPHGMHSHGMDTSSFCGGNVETYSVFADAAPELSPIYGSADGRFNYAEAYYGADVPREFKRMGAAFHVPVFPDFERSDAMREDVYAHVVAGVVPKAPINDASPDVCTAVKPGPAN